MKPTNTFPSHTKNDGRRELSHIQARKNIGSKDLSHIHTHVSMKPAKCFLSYTHATMMVAKSVSTKAKPAKSFPTHTVTHVCKNEDSRVLSVIHNNTQKSKPTDLSGSTR